jgi:hypothetical protein
VTALHIRQIWLIARLHITRVFFSRRSFWVYILALFPAIVFFGHALEVKFTRANWAGRDVPAAQLEAIREGDADTAVTQRLGPALMDRTFNAPAGIFKPGAERGRRAPNQPLVPYRSLRYFDGRRRWDLNFEAGALSRIDNQPLVDFEEDRTVFAAIFQHFYLRLAIFFGCLGIFINLFRGEMLDKTLHFWFLAPMRREVLLAGKYLAGLIAASVIFTTGALLAYGLMLWPQDSAQVATFWSTQGPQHLFWYAASAALATLGYGSVFLASGMLLRNPIIPAIVILAWESINGVLPALLQKLSVLYYVQSLAPVPPPLDADAPLLIRLLASPASPAPPLLAVAGLVALTGLVLWVSARTVRKLEINYGTD